MSAQHTPGLWAFRGGNDDEDYDRVVVFADDGQPGIAVIAEVEDQPEQEANARLIVAAPDLLAALRAVLPLAEAYLRKAPTDPDNGKLADARDAIAKAEGR